MTWIKKQQPARKTFIATLLATTTLATVWITTTAFAPCGSDNISEAPKTILHRPNVDITGVGKISVASREYKAITITNVNPEDLMPKVEVWDKNVYKHIEHLRIPEATVITDMMWKHGAGNHSAEEYQQLMMRLNTGMRWELPSWYDNYEIIWEWTLGWNGSEHAHTEWSILCTLLKHANLKLVNESVEISWQSNLMDYINEHPNSINIFWCSSYTAASNKADYDEWLNKQDIKDLCNSKNFIIFAAGTNINTMEWHLRNKIYNGE